MFIVIHGSRSDILDKSNQLVLDGWTGASVRRAVMEVIPGPPAPAARRFSPIGPVVCILNGRCSAPFPFSLCAGVFTASTTKRIAPKPTRSSMIEELSKMGEGSFKYHWASSAISERGGGTIVGLEVLRAVIDLAGYFYFFQRRTATHAEIFWLQLRLVAYADIFWLKLRLSGRPRDSYARNEEIAWLGGPPFHRMKSSVGESRSSPALHV